MEADILLVEDSDFDAELVEAALRPLDVRLQRTTSLREAVDYLGRESPTLILLDLTLQDSRGEDTMRAVLAAAEDTPVVVLTGTDCDHLGERSIELGAESFCEKSADMHSLSRNVRFSLERAWRLNETRQSERNLRGVLGALDEGAIVVAHDDRILYVNGAAAAAMGVTVEELVDTVLPVALRDPDGALYLGPGRTPFSAKTRQIRWGQSRSTLIMLRDLRVQHELDQIRGHLAETERLRAIGTLASGFAHEINNPGQSLSINVHVATELCAELADLPGTDPRRIKEMANALTDCQGALEQVFDIVSRLRRFATKGSTGVSRVDLAMVAGETVSLVRPQLPSDVEVSADINATPEVVGDAGSFMLIVRHLIENAAESRRPEGRASRVTVSTGVRGDEAFVEVRDNGLGVPSQLLPYICDPFVTTKVNARGAGLGLALCDQILLRTGGRMVVDNRVGEGAIFEARWPIPVG